VVDAVTPLLGPLLNVVSAHGHVIMDGLMRELRALARNRLLSVLVSNITAILFGSVQLTHS